MTTDNEKETTFLSPEIEQVLEEESERIAVEMIKSSTAKAKRAWELKKKSFSETIPAETLDKILPMYEMFFISGYVCASVEEAMGS